MRQVKALRIELERARNVRRIGVIKREQRDHLDTIIQTLEWALAESSEKPIIALRERRA